jgi:putative endonuclease
LSKKNNIQAENGKYGELLAQNLLKNKGYEILQKNWRSGKDEIDIIAKHQDTIIFVEVKTRSNVNYGKPYDFVDERKQNAIFRAAQSYIDNFNITYEVRFDIISVEIKKDGSTLIDHITNAFSG